MTAPVLDHLAFAAPDLTAAVRQFTERTGVAPAPGGSHVGVGTANHLVDLGGGSYLEIIGPDPGQPEPAQPRPFGIDALTEPRLVTWAVRTDDIDALVRQARRRGYDPGEPVTMSRRTPEGELLEWRLAFPPLAVGAGLVPFLIDWGNSPHPTSRGLPGVRLVELRATHPDPTPVSAALAALGVDLELEVREPVELIAVVEGPDGTVRL